jgi:hypothetical protein
MDKNHILETLKIQGILCPNFCKYYFDEKWLSVNYLCHWSSLVVRLVRLKCISLCAGHDFCSWIVTKKMKSLVFRFQVVMFMFFFFNFIPLHICVFGFRASILATCHLSVHISLFLPTHTSPRVTPFAIKAFLERKLTGGLKANG